MIIVTGASGQLGRGVTVDPTLKRLLNRPPMAMRDVLAASLPS